MKFDTVRAEQLNTLSTNPVGELSDRELESIYGGQGAAGFGASSDFAASQRVHSFAVFCDRNTFSINAKNNEEGDLLHIPVHLLPDIEAINIGNCVTQVCTNND